MIKLRAVEIKKEFPNKSCGGIEKHKDWMYYI
jgi:hypothetical protein